MRKYAVICIAALLVVTQCVASDHGASLPSNEETSDVTPIRSPHAHHHHVESPMQLAHAQEAALTPLMSRLVAVPYAQAAPQFPGFTPYPPLPSLDGLYRFSNLYQSPVPFAAPPSAPGYPPTPFTPAFYPAPAAAAPAPAAPAAPAPAMFSVPHTPFHVPSSMLHTNFPHELRQNVVPGAAELRQAVAAHALTPNVAFRMHHSPAPAAVPTLAPAAVAPAPAVPTPLPSIPGPVPAPAPAPAAGAVSSAALGTHGGVPPAPVLFGAAASMSQAANYASHSQHPAAVPPAAVPAAAPPAAVPTAAPAPAVAPLASPSFSSPSPLDTPLPRFQQLNSMSQSRAQARVQADEKVAALVQQKVEARAEAEAEAQVADALAAQAQAQTQAQAEAQAELTAEMSALNEMALFPTPLQRIVLPEDMRLYKQFDTLTPVMNHLHLHPEFAHEIEEDGPRSAATSAHNHMRFRNPHHNSHLKAHASPHTSEHSPQVTSPVPLPASSSAGSMRFAEYFPYQAQVRASYEERRRMVPYGGFDMTMNPYRRPNSERVGTIFFTPKMSNAGLFGPDDGLNIAAILNTQRLNLLSQLHQRIYGGVFGVGGPGWQHFSRTYRPYGINPYMGPFSYYTPPPFPPEGGFPPFAPSGGGAPASAAGGAGGANPPGTPAPPPGPAAQQAAAAGGG